MTPRLTLNLGVRYDVNEMSNNCCWDRSRTYKILKAIGHPYGALPKTDKNNVAPRLGVAWDVKGDGSNVVRGSFGLFYGDRDHHVGVRLEPRAAGDGVRPVDALPIPRSARGSSPTTSTASARCRRVRRSRRRSSCAGGNARAAGTRRISKTPCRMNSSVGFSHLFSPTTVLSVDYLNVLTQNGWRSLEINPLLDTDNNPATPRVRALAADLQRVYGDPALLGPTQRPVLVQRRAVRRHRRPLRTPPRRRRPSR